MLVRPSALLGTILVGLLAVPNIAQADMPYPAIWSGFYTGIHGGYGWGETKGTSFDRFGAPTSPCVPGPGSVCGNDVEGPFVGAQVGYNFRVAPSFLLGVEADISGGAIDGTSIGCNATGCSQGDVNIDFLGTLRGRVGFVQGSWLLYATGGWAFGHAETDRTILTGGLAGRVASDSGWENGWVVGGGVEWAFLPGYSLKFEYQRLEFGDITREFDYSPGNAGAFRRIESELTIDTVRIGLNARLN